MEFNQILELIDHVSASELTAFTYETADLTLSMEHGKPQIIQGVMGETVENSAGQCIQCRWQVQVPWRRQYQIRQMKWQRQTKMQQKHRACRIQYLCKI